MDFKEWRASLKYHLAKNNIPVQDRPDGSLIAKFGTEYRQLTLEMQQENYQHFLDRKFKEVTTFA